jgi:hypothetical protein
LPSSILDPTGDQELAGEGFGYQRVLLFFMQMV